MWKSDLSWFTVFWAKMFDFSRAIVFCSGHRFLKHKMAEYAKNLGKARSLVTRDTFIYAIKVPAYHASSWRDVILELG